MDTAIIENSVIENVRFGDLFIMFGPLFNHVRLKGNVGRIKINTRVTSLLENPHQQAFDEFREKYYSEIDWALDISEAKFKGFDCIGIPPRLIIRDPAHQVILERDRICCFDWKKEVEAINFDLSAYVHLIMEHGRADEIVFATPLAAPKSKRDEILTNIQYLRDIGMISPD